MTIASLVTRSFFDGIAGLVTHGMESGAVAPVVSAVPNVKIDLDKHLFRPGTLPTVEQQLHALRQAEKEIEDNEQKIAKAEQDKEAATKLLALAKLEDKRKQAAHAARLEAKAQEQIRLLFVEKQKLMRQLNDEEEALVVLYSLPFMH